MEPEEPEDEQVSDEEIDEELAQWEEELLEEEKPEPLAFSDEYQPAPPKPVELVVPRHSDAFKSIGDARDKRFPAKRVARSAAALARALKSLKATG